MSEIRAIPIPAATHCLTASGPGCPPATQPRSPSRPAPVPAAHASASRARATGTGRRRGRPADRGALGERVPRGGDQDQPLVQDGFDDEPVAVRRAGHHRDADTAAEQLFLHGLVVADEDIAVDPRIPALVAGQQCRQEVGPDGGGAADQQPAGDQAADLLDGGDGLFGEQEDPLAVLGQDLPLGGRSGAGAGAVERVTCSDCSSLRTWLETEGWLMYSFCAAAEKPWCSTTCMKIHSRWRLSSTALPRWSAAL